MLKRIISSVIAVLMLVCGVITFAACDEQNRIPEDANFEPGKVIITLTKEETFKFKEYTEKDFIDVGCTSVNDLTKWIVDYVYNVVNGIEVENNKYVDVENFRRILCLELSDKTKVGVLRAIKILKRRKDISYAEPNYLMEII
ncbi:MAG: hypothetical protein J6U25_02600 [Clostridia bacterium]|nr:hypothetical protein [Clostridia bacterium]